MAASGAKGTARAWSVGGGPQGPAPLPPSVDEILGGIDWEREYLVLRWAQMINGQAMAPRSARVEAIDADSFRASFGALGVVVWNVAASQRWEGPGVMELIVRTRPTMGEAPAHARQVTVAVYLPPLPEQDDPEAGALAEDADPSWWTSLMGAIDWWADNGDTVKARVAPMVANVAGAWEEHGPTVRRWFASLREPPDDDDDE